jgi:hypothetical protein
MCGTLVDANLMRSGTEVDVAIDGQGVFANLCG